MLTEMDLKPQTEIGLRAELQIKKTAGIQLFDFIPLHWGELVLSFYSQKECIVLGVRFRGSWGRLLVNSG